jgi:hypothetical protein
MGSFVAGNPGWGSQQEPVSHPDRTEWSTKLVVVTPFRVDRLQFLTPFLAELSFLTPGVAYLSDLGAWPFNFQTRMLEMAYSIWVKPLHVLPEQEKTTSRTPDALLNVGVHRSRFGPRCP